MSTKKSSSSTDKIPVGQSFVNPSDLQGLRWAWKQKHLVLFLGAGVSIPYGIPSWKNLVLELLFEQVEHTRRLGGMWPHYRRALASWMTDYFDYSALVLARMVERDARKRAKKKGVAQPVDGEQIFLEKLRNQLYAQCKAPGRKRTTLQAIADLVQRSKGNVRCVVSFNFDGLLEEELAKRKVPTVSIFDERRHHSGPFPIIHPHGFVPRKGPIERARLVFTEDDYHKLTETVFHWGLSEMVSELRHSTVLFIGLSMSDPSLRRLLDATRNSDIPPHWQVQQRHRVHAHEQQGAITDIANRARVWGEILGYNEQKDPPQLAEALNDVLRQADTYDRALFETMGVKTIWLESFEDIPLLLDKIATGLRKRS
ncbi:MAG TPA: SIR2 family protein [Pyrinomonadaceae bacterium]|nr:SIR2 family protein [Pyrinomonadaceae bacterium]